MSSLAIPTSLAKTNEASLSVWCHSWWCVLHWEAHEAPLLISMLSWWTWQEIICAFCTQTTLWQPGFASTASKITRENNNNVKWPLLARESSEAVLHSHTSHLLTPVSLALADYDWGRSQLAFHQREYLALRPAGFIFARVKMSTFYEEESLSLCESCLSLCSWIKIKSVRICRHVKQAVPKTIKWLSNVS